MEMKVCSQCKRELTVDNFSKNGRNGLRADCKECLKQYYQNNKKSIAVRIKQYYKDNKETRVEYNKQYHQDNREACAEYQKQYIQNNKVAYMEYQKQYRQDNKKILTKKKKQYALEHLQETYIRNKKRDATKRLLPATLTLEQWENIKKHFSHKCAYCGREEKLTIEHFVPVSKLGELSVGNILPICSHCNSSKGDRKFGPWFKRQTFYSNDREQKILKYLGYENQIQQLALI